MKMPLNASQTIAVAAIAAALLGGAFALGRSTTQQPAPLNAPLNAALDQPAAANDAAPPTRVAEAPRPQPSPQLQSQPQPQSARLCEECARVVSVHMEERQGQGSGLGAIGGAVLGGILGNQVGGGTGRKLATIGGAAAGGYAGNELEKRHKSSRVWVVKLADRDGSTRRHEQAQNPNLRAGDIVLLRDGQLQLQPR